MGGVGIVICILLLGMVFVILLLLSKFKWDECEVGKVVGIMGMIGISEGVILFVVVDFVCVFFVIIVGGIVGNVIGFFF